MDSDSGTWRPGVERSPESDPGPVPAPPRPWEQPAQRDQPASPRPWEKPAADGPPWEQPAAWVAGPHAGDTTPAGAPPGQSPGEPPVPPPSVRPPSPPGGYPSSVAFAGPRGGGLFPLLAAALVGALVSTLVTLGLTGALDRQVAKTPLSDRLAQNVADRGARVEALPAGSSVAEVAEAVLPSVAQVEIAGGPQGPGSGSAVVYREDGLLVTNNHVVLDANEVTVILSDLTELEAEVVGTDAASDLALLRVDQDGLPVPAFAPEPPRVGETAIAIGSPFGLDSTVTSGIISATERNIPTPDQQILVGVIQTDAAINPGNSGGALVNDRGELIGINSAILSRTGQNGGIGFAVPVDTVQTVAEQLLERGVVEYAQLGVLGTSVTESIAARFDMERAQGALIEEVLPDSAAADAGLERGDVVIAVDQVVIRSQEDLYAAVRGYMPGDEAQITFLREGDERTADVTFGTADAEED